MPKLRFPEFRNAGGWVEGQIADIAEVLQGYGFPERYQGQKTGEYPFYKVSDISNTLAAGNVFIEQSANYITEDVLRELKAKPIPEGTTIFAKIGEAIRSNRRAITTKSCLVDNNVAGVKRIQGQSTDLFVYFTMETIALIDYSGGVVPSVNKSAIENIAVQFPEVREQQKIAECLRSVDELIAAHAQKLDALKTHKKGLMQQLFPRQGETQPHLRFPEFRNAGEWEQTTIGALGAFYYGKSAPKWSLEKDAPTACVRYGELYTKFGPVITTTYSRTNIGPESLRFSKGGEILIPRVGEKPEDFGKCCCYLPLRDIAIGEMISVFETKEHPLFYTYYFRTLYREFAKVVEGQNVKNLYYTELEPLPIFRPTVAEQQRIADYLTSLDDLIAAQTQKLDVLNAHKKGLKQQLFPTLESKS